METLKLAYPTNSATILPFKVAEAFGLFDAEGLKVELLLISGSSKVVATLMAGEADATYDAFDILLGPASAGAKVKYLAEILDEVPYDIVVSKDIKTFNDLKGKAVGGATAGTFANNVMLAALSKGGIDPTKDVEYVNMSSSTARLTAITAGKIAATVVNPPSTQRAHQQGLHTLVYAGDALGKWAGQGITSTDATIEKKGEALKRLVSATRKAVQAAKDRPAEATKVLQDYLELDAATAADVLKAMIGHFRADGRWDPAGLQNSIDSYKSANKDKDPGTVATITDDRFLK